MKRLLLPALFALAAPAFADEALLARPEAQAFVERTAREQGLDRAAVADALRQAVIKPNIVGILDRPSTARPWYQFRPAHVNTRLASEGAAFWQQNASWLELAENRYQVDPAVIVAIIGIETGYGRNMGSFRVLDALATIGFNYPRRADYFQGELSAFLRLARDENGDPTSFKGSYAGAMGMPQFMPSSFRKWAVDLNGDGKRDIWSTPADAIGSVANYLQQHGWQHGADILLPAALPARHADTQAADKLNQHYSVGELKKMGVQIDADIADPVLGVVFPLEVSAGNTQYWLGLQNFYTITRYNKSTLYATAVAQLSQDIAQRRGAQLAVQ